MSTTSILLVLSGGCWILFVYPYLLYPQALRFLSKQPVPRAPIQLTTSLLFCAHNEIDCLPAKLENLRELKHRQPALQILVYDDASTDGTFEMLAAEPQLLTVLRGPGRTGKAAGMKRLVEQATGDVLIFTDANIILAADVVDRLLPYYASDEIGGVCCTIKSQVDAATITSQVGSAYVAIDDRLQQLEIRDRQRHGGNRRIVQRPAQALPILRGYRAGRFHGVDERDLPAPPPREGDRRGRL